MRYSFLLTLVFFVLISCDKEKIGTNRDVESFSDASFKQYDPKLNVDNFLLTEDGSLILVGNGIDENLLTLKPFILQLDLQKEISWLNFMNLDQRNIYRKINVLPTLDGEYMVLSNSDPENKGKFNIDMTKVEQNGNINWNKRFIDENNSLATTSVIQLPNEDYIVYSEIQQGGFSLINQLQLNRISGNGDLIWTKIIDSTNISTSRQLIYFPENNCVIGLSENNLEFNKGIIKLHKFDLEGNVIWQKTITIPEKTWPLSSSIIKTMDEDFMLTYSSSTGSSGRDYDILLIKMDQEGNTEWEKTYNGHKIDYPQEIIQTNDGKFVLLSTTTSFGNGKSDVMLSKIDETGELIWEKVYGSSESDQASEIEERSNGNLVIIGHTDKGNASASGSRFNLFIFETDQEGNPE